jgi:hypothetical protein
LSEVKKTSGGEDGISLEFRIIMRICVMETAFPIKTRNVKISYQDNTEIVSIQLVL